MCNKCGELDIDCECEKPIEIEINVPENVVLKINGIKYNIRDWEVYGVFRAIGGF